MKIVFLLFIDLKMFSVCLNLNFFLDIIGYSDFFILFFLFDLVSVIVWKKIVFCYWNDEKVKRDWMYI